MHYSHINTLRGIAILMVIVVHTSQLFNFSSAFETQIFDYGKMGVQLFFIASAYTLCLSSHYKEKEQNHISKFYIRRYFRIFPIYYLGIIGYYLLNLFINNNVDNYSVKNVLSNILFIHGLVPTANNTIVPGGWSIGTEMLFYLIFPFIFKFLTSSRPIIKSILIILIAHFIIFYFQRKPDFNYEFFYFNILNQISVFIIGILFFIHKRHFNDLKKAVVVFLCFTAFALFVSTNSEDFKIFGYRYAFRLIPMISAVSFCALFIIAEQSKLVNNVIFQKIGLNSYSIYIIHFILPFFYPTAAKWLFGFNNGIYTHCDFILYYFEIFEQIN
ncbi:acyltransferase [Chryseobacterium indologenes]|uniref:acyltransferase family protein n=1 Tax=Chryseobacterium indologenes TaxID=253 RepID=UPI001D0D3F40|nr:acyltransferase [Chryseobacterium indologenes]